MRRHFFYFLIIFFLYSCSVFFLNRPILSYTFNPSMVNDFLHSQNIFGDVKNRIFVSDEVVYLSSGYLYAKGALPTEYNFEHPPLLKYLFGYSIVFFNNPYFVQILFALTLLVSVYYFSFRLINNPTLSMLPPLLLMVDPLFINMQKEALLDLGQSTFIFLYYLCLFYAASPILLGILLGLIASSKFWSTAVVVFILGILFDKRRKNRTSYVKSLVVTAITAALVFSLTYSYVFIQRGGKFNIVFFQMKILKYMLVHNQTTYWGGSIILFFTGFFKSWWRPFQIMRSHIWSILWPVILIAPALKHALIRKMGYPARFTLWFPYIYLFYLGNQLPFARYFIVILPFSYIIFIYSVSRMCGLIKGRR
ncbi:hypothetical protein COT62_01610 [Candidatus Roizmanbacteria bacterium CG09_land_8_20_14_0_10_41_9]|uniref:Glycosyltransferase RgtA/B/C/D-like domain-containing protein n=1 Tax=Candidatus Roizmanbacteria bacterium CG09_land_8_20_14_0_10_41_9 TaxID=1974850 RepID=A0A2H0WV76_9BACT|nr:MAG: hypothetical protein COT62_01610 [Candidatus Roizmanbacteria bacterium CG09_land_8_20_14_0_10_41_9]